MVADNVKGSTGSDPRHIKAMWKRWDLLLGWKGFGGILAAIRGFPGSSDGKESACSAGDPALIPGLGKYVVFDCLKYR